MIDLEKLMKLRAAATPGPWCIWEWANGSIDIRSGADPDEEHVGRVLR